MPEEMVATRGLVVIADEPEPPAPPTPPAKIVVLPVSVDKVEPPDVMKE